MTTYPFNTPRDEAELMINRKDAGELATKKIQEYVNACECVNEVDIGEVLMYLLSITSKALVATQGQSKAVAMIKGTAQHFEKAEFSSPWHKSRIQ